MRPDLQHPLAVLRPQKPDHAMPGPALRRPSDDSPSVPNVPRREAPQPRPRPQLREDRCLIRFRGDEHRHLLRPERTIRSCAIRLDRFRRDAAPAHDVIAED